MTAAGVDARKKRRGKTATARSRAKKRRHRALLEEESRLWAEGLIVAGLDEVGVGPLAGPVVAACVVLDPSHVDELLGVDDSKALAPAEREGLAVLIREHARAWCVAESTVEEIDRINVLQASLRAMCRALDGVQESIGRVDHLLVDARTLPETDVAQTPLIKGDARSLSIAAASILAKVARDELMTRAAVEYPAYGFDRHKGYHTPEHVAALREHGVTPLHRRTFEPVSTMLTQLRLFD